jgi:hypothetical protein
MTFVHPPTICARLREPMHLELLQSSAAFHSFCVSTYRKKDLLSVVLENRFTEDELEGMSPKEKLKSIYMCDLTSLYADTEATREDEKLWRHSIMSVRSPLPLVYGKPPDEIKHAVQYLKSLLQVDSYYTLPQPLFDVGVSTSPEAVAFANAEASTVVLQMVGTQVPEFDFPAHQMGQARSVIFEIINNRPEARFSMDVPHLFDIRTKVTVAKCLWVSTGVHLDRWEVTENVADQVFFFSYTFETG